MCGTVKGENRRTEYSVGISRKRVKNEYNAEMNVGGMSAEHRVGMGVK